MEMLKPKYIGMLVVGVLVVLVAILLANNVSADNDEEWTKDIRLTNDDQMSWFSRIAINGDHIQVVWQDKRNDENTNEIYYKESFDDGERWETDVLISKDDGMASERPAIANYGQNVYVVWADSESGTNEIFFRKGISDSSGDEKTKWETMEAITNTGSDSLYPSIAVYRNDIYVVWSEDVDGNWEIYYRHGLNSNNGVDWDADIIRLTNEIGASQNPDITVFYNYNTDGNNVYVVWDDDRTGNYGIYCNYSEDNGETWEGSQQLSHGLGNSTDPRISTGNDGMTLDTYLHVVWSDDRHVDEEWNRDIYTDNWEIYYIRGKSGNKWENEERLTNTQNSSYYPKIAVYSNQINVVWQDYIEDNYEICYKYGESSNNGVKWAEKEQLTKNDDDFSGLPDIAQYSDKIHVVWHDSRNAVFPNNNHEIYYKRSPEFEPPEDPYIYLYSPGGGEEWGNIQTIEWDTQNFNGDTTYTINISIDGGDSWQKIDTVNKNEDGEYHTYYYDFDTNDYSDSNLTLINITGDNGTKQAWDQSLEFTIDNTPPETSDTSLDIWYNYKFNVFFNVDDKDIGSNCSGYPKGTTYYTIDGSEPTTKSKNGSSVQINETGIYTIKYFSIDDTGNEETTKKTANYQAKLDMEEPTFESWVIPDMDIDSPDTIKVSVDVEDQDEYSGLNTDKIDISYAIGTEEDHTKIKDWTEISTTLDGKKAKGDISENWKDYEDYFLYLKCKAYDNAGNDNTSFSDGNQIEDKSPPYLEILDPEYNSVWGDEVTIRFKAYNLTNYFKIQYKLGVGILMDIDELEIVPDANHIGTYPWNTAEIDEGDKYKIRVEEAEIYDESKIFTIDHTPPTTNIVGTGNNEVNYKKPPINVTLDPEEELAITYYRIDETPPDFIEYEEELNFQDEGEYIIEFYSIDNVGNKEDIKSRTVILDKTPPNIGVWSIANITYTSEKKQTISVEVSDDYSGINVNECKFYWIIDQDGNLPESQVDKNKIDGEDITFSDDKLTIKLENNWADFGDWYLYIKCIVSDYSRNTIEEMQKKLIVNKTIADWDIKISSLVGSDNVDKTYIGETVKITLKENTDKEGLEATITITSDSKEEIIKEIKMNKDSKTNTFTYDWNTTNLLPGKYTVDIIIKHDVLGEKSTQLTITLEEKVEEFVLDFKLENLKFMVDGKEITEAREGDKIDIEVTLKLNGEFKGSVTIEFYKGEPSESNKPFGFVEKDNLEKTNIITYQWTIAEGFKGSQTIYAVIDREEIVNETDDNNNQVTKDIEIKKGASSDDGGLPIFVIIIPIAAVAGIGGVYLYIKREEEYEYEDDDEE